MVRFKYDVEDDYYSFTDEWTSSVLKLEAGSALFLSENAALEPKIEFSHSRKDETKTSGIYVGIGVSVSPLVFGTRF